MPRMSLPPLRLLAFLASIALPAAASAQSETGALEAFPFELPFELVSASDADGVLERVVATPFETCVDHFQSALIDGTELGDGWTIGGQGFDVREGNWRFGLFRDGRTLYDLVVDRDAEGCAVRITTDALIVPGGRFRWSYPPLYASDGEPVEVDPFVIND